MEELFWVVESLSTCTQQQDSKAEGGTGEMRQGLRYVFDADAGGAANSPTYGERVDPMVWIFPDPNYMARGETDAPLDPWEHRAIECLQIWAGLWAAHQLIGNSPTCQMTVPMCPAPSLPLPQKRCRSKSAQGAADGLREKNARILRNPQNRPDARFELPTTLRLVLPTIWKTDPVKMHNQWSYSKDSKPECAGMESFGMIGRW